ncbi:MAG: hypothetical protein IJC71_06400, partial [Clostridia bacterium]|nr:hypothetical protein [Clostridia bacterium]
WQWEILFTVKISAARRSIKVLIQLFQKLAGVEGTESLIDRRNGRNTQAFEKVPFFASFFPR